MRVMPDRLTTLLLHGLSENEARVYLALLDYPSLGAGALAKVAEVPRNRLYEVLENMQAMDLVEVRLQDGTRKFRARPFAAYLEQRARELRGRVEEIESRMEYFQAAFQPPPDEEHPEVEIGTTRAIMGRKAVAREIRRMLEGAERTVAILSSASGAERVARHVLHDLPERPGLRCLIVAPASAAHAGALEGLSARGDVEVAWIDADFNCLRIVVDEREGLVVHPVPDNGNPHNGRDFALHTTNPALVKDQALLSQVLFSQGRKGAVEPRERAGTDEETDGTPS